jgi:molybdopterin/thiamine biosynthesis adenylyltransferase
VRTWWERDPQRYEDELATLAAAGIVYTRDEAAFAKGVLTLHLQAPTNGRLTALTATFPDFYPYFRPEVMAPDLNLIRHQNPIGKNLCLIGRRTSTWFVEQTLADLLHHQLPPLLEFDRTADLAALAAVEEPIGEPASDYYNAVSVAGSYMLFDSGWSIDPNIRAGTFEAAGRTLPSLSGEIVQAIITKVSGEGGELATWQGPVPEGMDQKFPGRWIRRDAVILGGVKTVVESLTEEERAHLFRRGHLEARQHARLSAILFPEEVAHLKHADGWCIVQENHEAARARRPRSSTMNFVRTARAGAVDLAARMPAVADLVQKSILIVGLGALGAPAAIALARAGAGKLTLLDHDIMEPATARRWPIGWPAFGCPKVVALRDRLAKDYPWTEVHAQPWRLGGVEFPDMEREPQRVCLERALEGCDLILDATAELGVNHFLSEVARLRGVPYVLANATPGIWGGMVAQFLPGKTKACWMCLRHALYGETATIELPPADPEGEIQPPGCAEATFTGSAFDAEEVSLEAVRMVAGALRSADGYPETDWDVSILQLREQNGRRQPPHWDGRRVSPRPTCTCQNP